MSFGDSIPSKTWVSLLTNVKPRHDYRDTHFQGIAPGTLSALDCGLSAVEDCI